MGYNQTLAQLDYRRHVAARTLQGFSEVLDVSRPWSELGPSLRVKLMLVAQELVIISEMMDALDAAELEKEGGVQKGERPCEPRTAVPFAP